MSTTDCDPLLGALVEEERGRWRCRRVAPDTILLITSRHFSDGDTVELLVQVAGDEVVVSDGGEVLARLDNAGVNVESSRGRVGRSWTTLLAAHGLEHDDGQLVRRSSLDHAVDVIHEMTDAVANVDGLRLLAPRAPRLAFPDRVTSYLQAEFPVVEPRPSVGGRSGARWRPTAAAGSEQRLVYVHTASGRTNANRQVAAEHCYTMFSDINGHIPPDRKLIVLDDQEADRPWRDQIVALLSTVAYVGSWTERERWTGFVHEAASAGGERLLIGSAPTLLE